MPIYIYNMHTYARVFLLSGADVNFSYHWNGMTALHFGARVGRCDKIKALVEHGANVHARDVVGRTPLLVAANNGEYHAIALLAYYGSQLDAKDDKGFTAMDLANRRGFAKCKAALIAAADIFVSRNDALVALEAIADHLLLDVAEVVVHHRYSSHLVGSSLARELEAKPDVAEVGEDGPESKRRKYK